MLDKKIRAKHHMTSPITLQSDIEEIVENFSFLEEWEDRYGYLIELGKALTPMADEHQTDVNKVKGCVSQVWVVAETEMLDGKKVIHFRGKSDAHIVSGLVAIALVIFSGKTPDEIVLTDEKDVFQSIGLEEHLTPQRTNGLRSMVLRLKELASKEL